MLVAVGFGLAHSLVVGTIAYAVVTLSAGGASIVVGAIWWVALGRSTSDFRADQGPPKSRTAEDGMDLNDKPDGGLPRLEPCPHALLPRRVGAG